MDSNFGQQTYMYSALKALDRINASIARAVVLHGRDQGRPRRTTEMRAEQPWCIDHQHQYSGCESRGPPDMTLAARDEARKPTDTCSRGI